jgi:cell division septal protein FtsQ
LARPSAIAGQKLARKRRKHAGVTRRKILGSAARLAIACGICAVFYFLPSYVAGRISHGFKQFVVRPVRAIEFVGGQTGELRDFDRAALSDRLITAANGGRDLKELAHIAASVAPLARVNIMRTSPGRLLVAFEKRTPALRAGPGGNLLVDNDGFAYGSCCVLPGQEEEAALPLLEGVSVAQGATDSVVGEAIDLKGKLSSEGLEPAALRYHAHRGYMVIMKPDMLEVAMGRAPFADKISRLSEVLGRIERHRVSRIELDYHGKAFIKERKI